MLKLAFFLALVSFAVFYVAPVAASVKTEFSYQSLFYQELENTPHAVSSEERINSFSQIFLGVPYVGGGLGEGEQGKYDKDPLVRFNEFDCTTYVETILAGVMSSSENDFMPSLLSFRYKDSNVTFTSRNHFPSLDWIPNNQDKLKDITQLVAQESLMTAEAIIDKTSWYRKMEKKKLYCDKDLSAQCDGLLDQLHDEGDAFLPEVASLDYVPLTALYLPSSDKSDDASFIVDQSILDRIPSGSVISMVRPNWELKQWIGTNMNVSHQGFAIRKEGQLLLRHASVLHKKVIDEDFVDYFSRYTSTSSLKGFNVQVLRN
ncbi:N-acetylmuramoyl-L-alanine amidase-like domain-containing protein [Marinomonas sp. 2405UD66-6]|uniref:N-acetylmuramoyl-L-alanine amidase-like domain-containing protein n=1 Tax=Marinomonas sp. 2405UD66-6 TaxID=3391834 RepID=UPI0039C9579D